MTSCSIPVTRPSLLWWTVPSNCETKHILPSITFVRYFVMAMRKVNDTLHLRGSKAQGMSANKDIGLGESRSDSCL